MSSDFFRPEETSFVNHIEDIFQRVSRDNYLELTDFFNMREQYIIENIGNRYSDLQLFFEGGHYNSERKRVIIAPDYYQLDKADFELEIVEIRFNSKFIQLKHSQILGALVNQGINRDFFGDIITDGKRWQFFVKQPMGDYIINNLQKIGNNTVHLSKTDLDKVLLPRDDSDTENITVQSFRLDTIIASVYNVSRQNAKDYISSGKVTVNWIKTLKSDYFVSMNDTISVRGYGRIRITDILGQTQNSKWKMTVNVIRK